MSYTVALVGHSFVAGLNHHFLCGKGRARLANGVDSLPAYVTKTLEVDDYFRAIHMLGMRGATIQQLSQFTPQLVTLKPTILIIDLGSNDLSAFHHGHSDIMKLTSRYYESILKLLKASGASLAYICSCLPRNANIARQTPQQFLQSMHTFNTSMKAYCCTNNKLIFHTHKGFINDPNRQPLPISTWSRDGIHPNTSYGREHYKKSVRNILLDSVQHLHTPRYG